MKDSRKSRRGEPSPRDTVSVSPVKITSNSQPARIFCNSFPAWLRWSSVLALVVSVGLLCLSFLAQNFQTILSVRLIPLLLFALIFALLLNVYVFWHLHREHQETDRAFRDTDCEFSAIFHSVPDAVLILDHTGKCLDANPAAAAILRISGNQLLGKNISCFFSADIAFSLSWLLQNNSGRGRAQLLAGDRTSLFVDFTATANYVPGRHVLILSDVTERTYAELSLRKSEERFQYMANNIQEMFWTMDADTKEIIYVNPAYSTITGHSVESLHKNPSSYRELIHPEDRIRVLSRLQEVVPVGSFDEEFRFIRSDGEIRWVWAKGCLVRKSAETQWLVGTAQDITSRKQAEMKISEQLDVVEAALAEAEALRKSTLALSQNLAMDSVLDTLLQCISELIPFDRATVLFVEEGTELLVAREAPNITPKRIGLTLKASQNIFLERILFEKRAIFLSDVNQEPHWRAILPLDRLTSWLGVPLLAAGRVQGILSLGSEVPHIFTSEHLRLAKSLSIPAAVAIQNARAHERAEIYASELKLRLQQLHPTHLALKIAEGDPFRITNEN